MLEFELPVHDPAMGIPNLRRLIIVRNGLRESGERTGMFGFVSVVASKNHVGSGTEGDRDAASEAYSPKDQPACCVRAVHEGGMPAEICSRCPSG